jgi:uncharacterized repeat protein (TIGR01451 family)
MGRFFRTAPLAALSALLIALALSTSASAATFEVDTDTDVSSSDCTDAADDCSLRGAIDIANNSDTNDTIVVPAGIYRLGGEDRELLVDKASGTLTIQGAGASDTVIDADGRSRVFDVASSELEISGLTLRDGQARNRSLRYVGSIEVDGDTAVINLEEGHRSLRLPPAAGLTGRKGGPIEDGAGGGALRSFGSDITIVDSVLSHNNAGDGGIGGAIFNFLGSVHLVRTTVHRNSADYLGGGIVSFGYLLVEDSTVSDNVGTLAAGGIFNAGPMGIIGSTVSGNLTLGHGGGVLDMGDGLFINSGSALAGRVGARINQEGPIFGNLIANSTFSDNVVQFGQGGALLFAGLGNLTGMACEAASTGACEPAPPEDAGLTVLDSTFADNTATSSDDFLISGGSNDWGRGASIYAAAPLDIGNSVIAEGRTRGQTENCGVAELGLIRSLGNNVESRDTCFLDQDQNDQIDQNLRLGDLRDNGGPTKTRALRAGSPAIDTFAGESCGELDQRGGARPPESGSAGALCDSGAYEANSLGDLSVDSHTDAPDPVTVGSLLTYSIVVRNAGPDAINGVTVAHVLPAGTEVVSAPNWALGTLAAGESRTLQAVVRPAVAGPLQAVATVSAPGMTDTKSSNDSATALTQVGAAPQSPQQQQQPPQQTPEARDGDVNLELNVPKTATIDEFFDGILVEADCKDEPCLRRFREHAAINTGATRIAGFNLTVSRTFLPLSSKKTTVRLRPCLSGSKTGKPHKRCMRNLRKAVKQAGSFKVKVVVTATDKAGNTVAQKAIVTIRPKKG